MDKISPDRRSKNMGRIRSKNSSPELQVRSLVHKLGFRFRLHDRKLPGKPDLVFPGRRCVIFVHGCFWHQHTACREGRLPGTRIDYWKPKLSRNVERDRERVEDLRRLSWRVLTIWECEIKDKLLAEKIRAFLQIE